jgi:hypothetical protein
MPLIFKQKSKLIAEQTKQEIQGDAGGKVNIV